MGSLGHGKSHCGAQQSVEAATRVSRGDVSHDSLSHLITDDTIGPIQEVVAIIVRRRRRHEQGRSQA